MALGTMAEGELRRGVEMGTRQVPREGIVFGQKLIQLLA